MVSIMLLVIVLVLAYGVYVMTDMTKALTDLKASINANGDAIQAAIAGFKGIADLLTSSKDDPDAVEELATELANQSASLGQAVISNTPAASPNQPATGVDTGSQPAVDANVAMPNVDDNQPATQDAPATPKATADGGAPKATADGGAPTTDAPATTDATSTSGGADTGSLSGPGA